MAASCSSSSSVRARETSLRRASFMRLAISGGDLLHLAIVHFHTPAGWQVNAEYRGEFGGLFPVQCHYTPDSGGKYTFWLCSPGEVSPVWLGVIVDGNGRLTQVVY